MLNEPILIMDQDDNHLQRLDRLDRDRSIQGKTPAFALIQVRSKSALPGILERVTGSGLLSDVRWLEPADAGVLYGPKRAAAWRTLDAKHFGLPEQRSVLILVARTIDPACVLFELCRSKDSMVEATT